MSSGGSERVDGGGGAAPRAPWTLRDGLLGWTGGAMIVLAILVLVSGGGRDDQIDEPTAAPPLRLVEPIAGARVSLPLALVFESGAPLSSRPGGWGTEEYHVHAEIDGREVMAGPTDVRPLGDGRYRWTIGGLGPGAVTLRLFWSDQSHRQRAGTGSPAIEVVLER